MQRGGSWRSRGSSPQPTWVPNWEWEDDAEASGSGSDDGAATPAPPCGCHPKPNPIPLPGEAFVPPAPAGEPPCACPPPSEPQDVGEDCSDGHCTVPPGYNPGGEPGPDIPPPPPSTPYVPPWRRRPGYEGPLTAPGGGDEPPAQPTAHFEPPEALPPDTGFGPAAPAGQPPYLGPDFRYPSPYPVPVPVPRFVSPGGVDPRVYIQQPQSRFSYPANWPVFYAPRPSFGASFQPSPFTPLNGLSHPFRVPGGGLPSSSAVESDHAYYYPNEPL